MKVSKIYCDCCKKEFSKTNGFGELKLSYNISGQMEYLRISDICKTCVEKLIKVINKQINQSK